MNKKELTNARLIEQKRAIERVLASDDGKLMLQYLADVAFSHVGAVGKDGLEYAFWNGQRSLLVSLLQFAEKDVSNFTLNSIYEMVKFDEGKF
jgi:hypothetical protein